MGTTTAPLGLDDESERGSTAKRGRERAPGILENQGPRPPVSRAFPGRAPLY
jgi:hypothetical protein